MTGNFFCDPHSPWQRGGIENANGLLRRDLPGKTRLDGYMYDDIDDIVWNLNSTPRKCLDYKTPSKHSPPTSVSRLKSEPNLSRFHTNSEHEKGGRGRVLHGFMRP